MYYKPLRRASPAQVAVDRLEAVDVQEHGRRPAVRSADARLVLAGSVGHDGALGLGLRAGRLGLGLLRFGTRKEIGIHDLTVQIRQS